MKIFFKLKKEIDNIVDICNVTKYYKTTKTVQSFMTFMPSLQIAKV